MAVALTQTINVPFGSGLVVPGTGVLLNDEMDDFYLEAPNAFGLVGNAAQRARARQAAAVEHEPDVRLRRSRAASWCSGSPGGSSIPSAVAWVIREVVEGRRSGEDAVRSPRVHHQWVPDVLQVEPRFDRSAAARRLGRAQQEAAVPGRPRPDGRARARRLARRVGLPRRRRTLVGRSVEDWRTKEGADNRHKMSGGWWWPCSRGPPRRSLPPLLFGDGKWTTPRSPSIKAYARVPGPSAAGEGLGAPRGRRRTAPASIFRRTEASVAPPAW